MPGTVPVPTRLFHITALPNLPKILADGGLRSKNQLAARGTAYANIAYANIQALRAEREICLGPRGVIHDYVPLYFAPRSPMLCAINAGTVPNCPYGQADIIHLETTVELVQMHGLRFVFFNMHSRLALAEEFDTHADLGSVHWDVICEPPLMDGFCRYWNDKPDNPRYVNRKALRQAEFLIHDYMPMNVVRRVGVFGPAQMTAVQRMLTGTGVTCAVEICRDWYY